MTTSYPSVAVRFIKECDIALGHAYAIQHALDNHLGVNPITLDWSNE